MSAIINIATKIAYASGNIIQQGSRNFSGLKANLQKHQEYVSELRKKSENIIINNIQKSYPLHEIIITGKTINNNHSEYSWIIEPIDNNINFTHGHPQYCISIAFKHKNKITHTVIFDPNRNDLYKAELGKGAFLNDRRIRVSNINNIQGSLVATGFPTPEKSYYETHFNILKEMIKYTAGQRSFGSISLDLAFVASGYLDGFWHFNLNEWDIAAGYLMIKEAGGLMTDFKNSQNFWQTGDIVTANSKIIGDLLKIIQANI